MSEFSKAAVIARNRLDYIDVINKTTDYTLSYADIKLLLLSVINAPDNIGHADITFSNVNGVAYSSKNITPKTKHTSVVKYKQNQNVASYFTTKEIFFSVDHGLLMTLNDSYMCYDIKMYVNVDINKINLIIKPHEVSIRVLPYTNFHNNMPKLDDGQYEKYLIESFKHTDAIIELEINYSKVIKTIKNRKHLHVTSVCRIISNCDEMSSIHRIIQSMLKS